jgi:23S rRNA (uracil1939-C5)-methyltransferase
LAAVDVVENAAGSERAAHLHVHGSSVPRELEALAQGLTGLSAGPAAADGDDDELRAGSRDGGMVVLAGHPAVVDQVPVSGATSVSLRHGARSFFQANRFLVAPLVDMVIRASAEGPALDLFAGTGLFGLALAAAGREAVTLVEGDPSSGRDLVANATAFGAAVAVRQQSVEAYLAESRPRFATWIVDPPRSGLPEAVRVAVLRDRPHRLVYVSCDPATLARDVRALVGDGYEVQSLVGLDMFPSTAHVEAVCVLETGP